MEFILLFTLLIATGLIIGFSGKEPDEIKAKKADVEKPKNTAPIHRARSRGKNAELMNAFRRQKQRLVYCFPTRSQKIKTKKRCA